MPAYLDHAATTPVRPEVVDVVARALLSGHGNPSGAHGPARAAREVVDVARDAVAELTGFEPAEVIFTSGGTEADNLAVLGLAGASVAPPGSVVVSAVEHHAVLRPAAALRAQLVPVDADGAVDLDALAEVLDDRTTLVSVQLVNNEVGTLQPLHKVRRVIDRHAPRALLHTDAVQAAPWLDLPRYLQFADAASLSAHKFGGPQGVGALLVRRPVAVRPLLHGGGQERERRSGTHNVAGIAGMAEALRSTAAERDEVAARVQVLRDRLVDGVLAAVPGAHETRDRSRAVPGSAHLCLPGVESEALLVLLDEAGVSASAGASCSSGAMEPSHVLLAMGVPPDVAKASLRMTLGWTTTDEEIDLALEVLPSAVQRLRGWMP